MKDNLNIFSVLAIVAVLLSALAYFDKGDNKNLVISDGNTKTITLSGQSERFVAPDTASVNFSMTKKSKSTKEATNSVNERIEELLKALKKFGVEEKDIKTTNYNIYPEYNYSENYRERTFDGYRVTQSIQVKIRDLDKASDILSQVGQLEVDNLSGLNFFIDDDEKIKEELRAEAIKDAKQKAKDLGKELGVNLNTIVGFSEGSNYGYPRFDYAKTAAFESFGLDDSIEEAHIPAGENKMTANVSVTFEIN